MAALAPVPNLNLVANRPKAEPIFSTCRTEDDNGQHLRVDVAYADGSKDWEIATIGPVGDWVAPEIEEEHRERLERTLRRRHAQRQAEVKPADAPGTTTERESP